MKCPICGSEVFEHYAICPVCNYFGLRKEFANDDEAAAWERYVLKYYRALWARKECGTEPSINLESKEAIAIFQNYFSDDSHKYRLHINSIQLDHQKVQDMQKAHVASATFAKALSDCSSLFSAPPDVVSKATKWQSKYTGIEINTMYLKFGFMEGHNSKSQIYYNYGHEYYSVDFLIDKNVVSVFLLPKKDDELKDYLCSVFFSDIAQMNEFVTVLEFLKCGNSHFSKPFDDSISCILECKNEELTYDTYFRYGPIKPLVFYAEVSDFDEDNDELIDHGLCKVTISVPGTGNRPAPRIEDLYVGEKPYDIQIDLTRILKPNKGFGYHQWGPLRENEYDYDFYLDRKQKVLYSGTVQAYRKYKFEDELLMQQVFNYLVILSTYWLM